MRLRPYINEKDYEYVSKWVSNERIHGKIDWNTFIMNLQVLAGEWTIT